MPSLNVNRPEPNDSDQSLLHAARKGDKMAFRYLVERYEPVVAATINGMLGAGPDADDVGQETFIRFYKNLEVFEEKSSIKTYLVRIAMNRSIDELRRRKKSQKRNRSVDDLEGSVLEPSEDGSKISDLRSEQEFVKKAINQLADDHRSVVVLRMIDGYSTKETAAILDIPEGTVLSRLARANKKLAEILEPFMREIDGS